LMLVGNLLKKKEWPIDLPKVHSINDNICLDIHEPCPSFKRFLNALKRHNILFDSNLLSCGFFTWHGTQANSLQYICHDGLDPNRRNAQAYGAGEYFGWNAGISRAYCGSSCHMLLFFILNNVTIRRVPKFCYVVNNPIDRSISYCLPVAVITFGSNEKPQFLHEKKIYRLKKEEINKQDDIEKIKWEHPFRWYWESDEKTMEPYTDDINCILESLYDTYRNNSSDSTFLTPPIIRYIDDQPQHYRIDFKQNIQTNPSTLWRRKIKRLVINVERSNGIWWFMDEYSCWQKYESLDMKKIDNGYQNYVNNSALSYLDIQITGRPEPYRIHFLAGTQTNLVTNVTRPIKRTPL